jgi:hypothetical protein
MKEIKQWVLTVLKYREVNILTLCVIKSVKKRTLKEGNSLLKA